MDGGNYKKTTGSVWSKRKWWEVGGGEQAEKISEAGGRAHECSRIAIFITIICM